MIPTEKMAKALWEKYALPEEKQLHVSLVARVCMLFASECEKKVSDCHIQKPLLLASALLHDIDKSIPRLSGEQHPDTAVRVLREEGMDEVAQVVKTHSLHAILNADTSPKSQEEKILYLSDKMVKYEIIGVDTRFKFWREEQLPNDALQLLDRCYPLVKRLEKEMFDSISMNIEDVVKLA